jgi:RNA ligase (TIGR02306 family)
VRIRAQRFRGEQSFGTVQPIDDPSWPVGMSLVDVYNVTKYEPPEKSISGDSDRNVDLFHHYTDIENINNFPSMLEEGEEVVVTEKLHGTNSRMGKIFWGDDGSDPTWKYMAGSHAVRRKQYNMKGELSLYWAPFGDDVKALLDHLCGDSKNVVMFGEIFGLGVQDMHYGLPTKQWRGFDIAVEGRYLDHDEAAELFGRFNVPTVPILYRGPFSIAKVRELTDGPTTMCSPDQIAGKFKGREGVVIKPIKERRTGNMRTILKSISIDYLSRKGGTEFH